MNQLSNRPGTGNSTGILYSDYEKRWYEIFRSQVSPHRHACNQSVLKKNNRLHPIKMEDITRSDLQQIVNDNWQHPCACRVYAGMMRHMWTCAVADGICQRNIAIGLNLPKKNRQPVCRRPLTEQELKGILHADLNVSERFLLDVLLQFGLRPGEAFALSRGSFHRTERVVIIDRAVAYNKGIPYLKETKTGVTRTLPVPDSFWNKIPVTDSCFYFVNEKGGLMTAGQRQVYQLRIIDKINKAMGGSRHDRLTDMTLYYFRHHKASLLYYQPGVSLKKKAEYMGHSEKMFLETYSHMMEEKEDLEALRKEVLL